MKTDYKFWYIRRDDNGFITEAAVRFYEGDIFNVNMLNNVTLLKVIRPQYMRTKRLDRTELSHLNCTFSQDKTGDVCVYTQKQFGKIKTDLALSNFLDKQIVKDTARQFIKSVK